MPRGFRVESGSALSQRLVDVVVRFGEYLKKAREAGKATPTKPMTSGELMVIMRDVGVLVSGSDVRAMVNHLRRKGWPIASMSGGYFYALDYNELNDTLLHLEDRISAMMGALDGLKKSFSEEEDQMNLF